MQVTTRIGIDVVEIARFARMVRAVDLEQTSLFTQAELEAARTRGHFVASLAGRFAAKEAVLKVLEDLDPFACDWTEIEIVSTTSGAPAVRLHGAAADAASERGVGEIAVSLSHSRTVAIAAALATPSCRT